MEEVLKMVQNITAFLLIAGIISSLLKGGSYRKYFSYVTGLVVLVLFLSPVMSFLTGKSVVKTEFNGSRYEKEKDEFLQELQVISEQSKEAMLGRYENALKEQITLLCNQSGVHGEVLVSVSGEGAIEQIMISLRDDNPVPSRLIGEIANTYGISEDVILIKG
ncbi:MAG: stage III sporulation protein AF [Lachnospiraceae bacterium]|mgnify:FL=1|nr:stage III sporulation protein AF [Lachnospiraceae bacterium]